MNKLCFHIKDVDKAIVEKAILGTKTYCINNHPAISPYLCLTCPSTIVCNRVSESQSCLEVHTSQTHHCLFLILETGFIVCKQCSNDFQDMICAYQGDDQQQIKKCRGFYNFIRKCWTIRKEQEMQLTEEDKKNTFGLLNLGNTCFFNSIIQAVCKDAYCQKVKSLNFDAKLKYSPFSKDVELYYDDILQNLEEQWIVVNSKKKPALTKYQHKPITDNSINKQFKKFLSSCFQQQIINPSALFQSVAKIYPLFKQYKQQDAQEFLRIFFDTLKEGELRSLDFNHERYKKIERLLGMKKLSFIDKYYGCYLANKLVCVPCGQVSWTLDLALDFSVQLQKKDCKTNFEEVGIVGNTQLKYHQDLVYPENVQCPALLKNFFSYESLSTYKCSKCLLSNSIRKFFIVQPPQVLTIVLKRFKSDMTKDSSFVPFEQKLDISGFTLTKPHQPKMNLQYELRSVIVHLGSSDQYGHYVCYRKQKGHWLYFSDEEVRAATWERVKMCTAYILFYTRL